MATYCCTPYSECANGTPFYELEATRTLWVLKSAFGLNAATWKLWVSFGVWGLEFLRCSKPQHNRWGCIALHPETNSSALKIIGWKMKCPFGSRPIFRFHVTFQGHIFSWGCQNLSFIIHTSLLQFWGMAFDFNPIGSEELFLGGAWNLFVLCFEGLNPSKECPNSNYISGVILGVILQ